MKRLTGAGLVLGIVLVPLTWSALASQQNYPGQPTIARMLVINSAPNEAVPVRLVSGPDVQPVAVMAPVALVPDASVTVHTARQNWEYRQVTITAGQDPLGVMNTAGADGWEAVGVVYATTAGSRVLLKRPR